MERPELPDYYADLGVTRDATIKDIDNAFQILDLHLEQAQMLDPSRMDVQSQRIKAFMAAGILTDPNRRALYDADHGFIRAQWAAYNKQQEKNNLDSKRAVEEAEGYVVMTHLSVLGSLKARDAAREEWLKRIKNVEEAMERRREAIEYKQEVMAMARAMNPKFEFEGSGINERSASVPSDAMVDPGSEEASSLSKDLLRSQATFNLKVQDPV